MSSSVISVSSPRNISSVLDLLKMPSAILSLNSLMRSSMRHIASFLTSLSTRALLCVGVHASLPYTLFRRSASGSMVLRGNTMEYGPYISCPCSALTMAMEGEGIAPSSIIRRILSSSRLCCATSVFVISTGSSSEKRSLTSMFPASLSETSLSAAVGSSAFGTSSKIPRLTSGSPSAILSAERSVPVRPITSSASFRKLAALFSSNT